MQIFLSALIDVSGHAGELDAAFEILGEAKTLGLSVGIVSYSSLMGACSNVRVLIVFFFVQYWQACWEFLDLSKEVWPYTFHLIFFFFLYELILSHSLWNA